MDLAQQLQHLYSQFGHLSSINIELHKDLMAIAVNNKAANALVFLQGAQVAEYQAHGKPKSLWLSEANRFQAGEPLRGGIPICWPWFGDLASNPAIIQDQFESTANAKAHGFARNISWQLDAVKEISPAITNLHLSADCPKGSDSHWPFAARLELIVSIGLQLKLSFKVINTDDRDFHYSSALHSYFAINHIDNVSVSGLENCEYLDKTQGGQRQQAANIHIDSEVDRIYLNTGNNISLLDGPLKTSLESAGSNSAVLWNPWQEKAKNLSQFNDLDYQKMICVETANVEDDYVSLAAGDSKLLELTITSMTLDA